MKPLQFAEIVVVANGEAEALFGRFHDLVTAKVRDEDAENIRTVQDILDFLATQGIE